MSQTSQPGRATTTDYSRGAIWRRGAGPGTSPQKFRAGGRRGGNGAKPAALRPQSSRAGGLHTAQPGDPEAVQARPPATRRKALQEVAAPWPGGPPSTGSTVGSQNKRVTVPPAVSPDGCVSAHLRLLRVGVTVAALALTLPTRPLCSAPHLSSAQTCVLLQTPAKLYLVQQRPFQPGLSTEGEAPRASVRRDRPSPREPSPSALPQPLPEDTPTKPTQRSAACQGQAVGPQPE